MRTSAIISVSAAVTIGAIVFSACKKEPAQAHNNYSDVPVLPAQPYMYADANNDLATLGRVLFYDPKLSLNNTISCGSCHRQEFGFSDNKAFSLGLEDVPTKRNVSTLIVDGNSKFWDGRAMNYTDAVLQPLQNHAEMKIYDFNMLSDKLSKLSYYPDLFSKAYNGNTTITAATIQSALAQFLKNFMAYNTRYDQSQGIKGFSGPSGSGTASTTVVPLAGLEAEGKAIFMGKGMCSQCHASQDLSGWQGGWENIGLDADYADNGVGNITKQAADNGKFVIPSLKNIAVSAPYMHDGRFKTLAEVINHYSEGIQPHPNLSWAFRDLTGIVDPLTGQPLPGVNPDNIDLSNLPARSLHFTDHEKQALEAFLRTLTDEQMLTDVRLSDPFRK